MQTSLLLLLVSDFQRLNAALQEQVYREFYHYLYSPILYMTNDHAATEDIIQDTFLATLRKPPDVDSEDHLKAWIKVVSRNMTLTYLRKRKRSALHFSLDDDRSEIYARRSSADASVEQQVEIRSLEEKIGEHLKELKDDQRAIVELKWKQGLSYKEIASEIQDTENAVKRKLYRARVFLKKKLRLEWGERHE